MACLSITYVFPPGRRFSMDTGGMAWNILMDDTPKILNYGALPHVENRMKEFLSVPELDGAVGVEPPLGQLHCI
jgi:hypothetical protein